MVDVAAGSQPQSVLRFDGAAPDLAWSSDGRSLAVKQNDGDDPCCCGAPGRLSVVDVESGTTPRWHQTPRSPAGHRRTRPPWPGALRRSSSSTKAAWHVKSGAPREDGRRRKACRWSGFTGWSPDGRFLGFGYPRLMTVDVETGAARVLFEESEEASLVDVRWWP